MAQSFARKRERTSRLNRSPAGNQVYDQHNGSHHQQKMNQTTADMADETEKPKDEQNYNYGPQHWLILLMHTPT